MIRTAAILARGLGSRMRQADPEAVLEPLQAESAESGVKGMIRIDRPFLDYVISALADAGIDDVVIVIGPEHHEILEYYTMHSPPQRVRVRFAVQAEPRGTADAVVAAATAIGDSTFLVLNSDNLYPANAIRELASLDTAGVVAFDRDALIADGSIEPERIRQFAVLDVGRNQQLLGIVEKPGQSIDPTSEAARWIGMNLWAVTPALVDACRRVRASSRGEFELPEAMNLALSEGELIRVVQSRDAVLDLSHRRDVANVTSRLRGTAVTP